MHEFYQLPLAELERRYADLVRTALPLWGIGRDSPLALLKLRENAVFRLVDPDKNKKYAVRVHRAGYHSDAELRSEWQWITALREYGLLTPTPRYSKGGRVFETVEGPGVPEPRQVDIVEWIEGNPLGSFEQGLQGSPAQLRARFEALGGIMARIHNQGERWQPPAGFTRHAWDLDGLVGEEPFWGRFWELPDLGAAQRNTLLQVRDALRVQLAGLDTSPERYGLIHADMAFENVLADADGLRVIDFDDCGYGWHLFDLATSLLFLQDGGHFSMAKEAMLAGYRRQRPLTDEHLACFPVLLVARATTYLGWSHTRPETATTREMTPYVITLVMRLAEEFLLGNS